MEWLLLFLPRICHTATAPGENVFDDGFLPWCNRAVLLFPGARGTAVPLWRLWHVGIFIPLLPRAQRLVSTRNRFEHAARIAAGIVEVIFLVCRHLFFLPPRFHREEGRGACVRPCNRAPPLESKQLLGSSTLYPMRDSRGGEDTSQALPAFSRASTHQLSATDLRSDDLRSDDLRSDDLRTKPVHPSRIMRTPPPAPESWVGIPQARAALSRKKNGCWLRLRTRVLT